MVIFCSIFRLEYNVAHLISENSRCNKYGASIDDDRTNNDKKPRNSNVQSFLFHICAVEETMKSHFLFYFYKTYRPLTIDKVWIDGSQSFKDVGNFRQEVNVADISSQEMSVLVE